MDFLADNPVLLSAAVFLARVCDVSLGTLRTILVFRAYRVRAALIGFVETLIWVSAAGMVLRDLSAWYVAVAYAGGFATGNFLGIWLEARLAMGLELVRVISANPDIYLARRLRQHGVSVTELDGNDDDGRPVEVLLIVESRRRLPAMLQLIESVDPDAIYTLSDVKRHHTALSPRLRATDLFGKRK